VTKISKVTLELKLVEKKENSAKMSRKSKYKKKKKKKKDKRKKERAGREKRRLYGKYNIRKWAKKINKYQKINTNCG
jgi:hypothetical protein